MTDQAVDRDKITVTGTSRLGRAAPLGGCVRRAHRAHGSGGGRHGVSILGCGDGRRARAGHHRDRRSEHLLVRAALPGFRNQTERLLGSAPAARARRATALHSVQFTRGPVREGFAAVQSYPGRCRSTSSSGLQSTSGFISGPVGTERPGEDWNAIFDFADRYLLGKPGDRRFDVIPPPEDTP